MSETQPRSTSSVQRPPRSRRKFGCDITSGLLVSGAVLLLLSGFVTPTCPAQDSVERDTTKDAARARTTALFPRRAETSGDIGVATTPENLGSPLTWSQLRSGLYVGTVWVEQVSDATQDPPQLAPAAGTFQFRIILHIDDVRRVRLVREVTLMRREDDRELVLVTDPRKLPDFLGVVRRDGQLVGVRYAAAAYDFDEPTGNRHPATVTATSDKGTLSFELNLGEQHPTHPYRHRYHPDLGKAFKVKRTMEIQLFEPAADQRPVPSIERLVGTYRETIEGLRNTKIPLHTAGKLVVHRINKIASLNE